jgi:tRNA-splicing ligase RtcB
MQIVKGPIALMPDVHAAYGVTVGSVFMTTSAIIPYGVGVDIGCGMCAVRTSLTANDLPDSLADLRVRIEAAIPHGGPGVQSGGWKEPGRHGIPNSIMNAWVERGLEQRFKVLCEKNPSLEGSNNIVQLGTLGGGNHFIEVCLDTENRVWVMLHSGSRGVGNEIGKLFVNKAKELMLRRDCKSRSTRTSHGWRRASPSSTSTSRPSPGRRTSRGSTAR